jgi:RNA polymerase sigma-70 factor (ECF subfamily)
MATRSRSGRQAGAKAALMVHISIRVARVNRLLRKTFSGKAPGQRRVRGRQSTPMKASGTLEIASVARLADLEPATRQEARLDQAQALDRFLADVEKRAFRIAQMAVRDRDDALDIVQGAMLRLARSYGQRPSEEWRPLFYRILYNGIRDWQRRSSVRSRIFSIWPSGSREDDEAAGDPYEHVADNLPEPSRRLMADEAMERLERAVAALPARQREAFVLRCLEGMDVAQTAIAMGCSEGSVKTHYFRALNALREQLKEVWGP